MSTELDKQYEELFGRIKGIKEPRFGLSNGEELEFKKKLKFIKSLMLDYFPEEQTIEFIRSIDNWKFYDKQELIEQEDDEIVEKFTNDMEDVFKFIKATKIARKLYPNNHINSFGYIMVKK